MLSQYAANCYFTSFVNLIGLLPDVNWYHNCTDANDRRYADCLVEVLESLKINDLSQHDDKLAQEIFKKMCHNDVHTYGFIYTTKKFVVDRMKIANNLTTFNAAEFYKSEFKYLVSEPDSYADNTFGAFIMNNDPFSLKNIYKVSSNGHQIDVAIIGFTLTRHRHHIVIARLDVNGVPRFCRIDPMRPIEVLSTEEINNYLKELRTNSGCAVEYLLCQKQNFN